MVLVCRAPESHRGVLFMLYRFTEKVIFYIYAFCLVFLYNCANLFFGLLEVDSQELQFGAEEVQFTVKVQDLDSVQLELFCCLYKDQEGRYSAFSPYLQLEQRKGAYTT